MASAPGWRAPAAAPSFVVVGPRAASGSFLLFPTSGTETARGSALRFPRKVRLRKSADFRRIQDHGRRVRQAHLLAMCLPGDASGSRFGITVSRKVGNAVVRNRVKRWLREAIRHERSQLAGSWSLVFIAHPSAATVGAGVIRAQVRAVIARIGVV